MSLWNITVISHWNQITRKFTEYNFVTDHGNVMHEAPSQTAEPGLVFKTSKMLTCGCL